MPDSARRLLVLFTTINMLNYIDRYVLPAVSEPMKAALGLSDDRLGGLQTAFLWVYMLTAPLFGILAERFSRTRLAATGIAIWSLATAAAAVAHDYPTLLVARALVGVGEASYATLGPAILADVIPESKRASKFTWFFLAIPVGSALGYLLGGQVASLWGWRAAFLVAGLPGLAFAGLMAAQPDPPRGAVDVAPDEASRLPYVSRIALLARNRVWLLCTLSYIGYTFAMGALSFWAPSLLQRKFGMDVAGANSLFGTCAVLTGIGGTLLGGALTGVLQKRFADAGAWLSGITLLMGLPAVAVVLTTHDRGVLVAALFVGMFLLFVNTSPVNALIVSSVPASLRASATAINVLLIHLLGDALSPALVGWRSRVLGETGAALGRALLLTLPAIALSGVVLFWARIPRDRPLAAVRAAAGTPSD